MAYTSVDAARGKLPSKLLFQFRDEAVSKEDLMDFGTLPCDEAVFADFKWFSIVTRKTRLQPVNNQVQHFKDTVNDLTFRKVTVPADEPHCLATLLGLSLEDLFEQPKGAITMSDVYRALPDQIPQDLIFIPSLRIQEPGFGWAPASLLSSLRVPMSSDTTGLLDNLGFDTLMDCVVLPTDFVIHQVEGVDFIYKVSAGSGSHRFAFHVLLRPIQSVFSIKRGALLIPNSKEGWNTVGVMVELIELPWSATQGDAATMLSRDPGSSGEFLGSMFTTMSQVFGSGSTDDTEEAQDRMRQWLHCNGAQESNHKVQQCRFLGLVTIARDDKAIERLENTLDTAAKIKYINEGTFCPKKWCRIS